MNRGSLCSHALDLRTRGASGCGDSRRGKPAAFAGEFFLAPQSYLGPPPRGHTPGHSPVVLPCPDLSRAILPHRS